MVASGVDRWVHGPLGTTPGSWTTQLQIRLSDYERRFAVTCPANDERWLGTRKGFEEATQAIHEMLRQVKSIEVSAISAAAERDAAQNRAAPSAPAVDDKSASLRRRRGIGTEEANVRARAYLHDKPNAKAREVAKGIGCALGTVSKLSAWKAVTEQRRKLSGGRKPTAVSLSSKMETVTAVDDETLDQLIAEQRADSELSPLVDDPPDRIARRKVRVYARR